MWHHPVRRRIYGVNCMPVVRGVSRDGRRELHTVRKSTNRLSTLILILALFVVLIGLFPIAALADRQPERSTNLVIGLTQYPATLHPNINSMLAKVYVLGMVRRPLTAYGHDWKLRCFLCLELPQLETGSAELEPLPPNAQADGRTQGVAVTYSINPNAVWGDGRPITTDDVIFTWEVGKAPKSGVSGQEIYRRILAIDRESDKRFTIHSDRVTFDYQAMSLQLLPEHLERQIFEADPARYRFRTRFETEPTNPGLHYGPYRISAVHRGSHIVLKPNPNWWGVPPAYAEIILRVIPKTAALEANFLSGSVDYIAGELGLTLNQALAFEKRYPDQYHYVYKPGLIYEHIDFNLNNPILAERKVRHALAHGIDRKAISLQLFGGKHPVANSNVSPLDWIHETDVARYQYNPAKAKALLVDAGWGTLRGGVRYNARGEKLSLELMTTAGNRTRELVEQVLQSQWRQIGVDITIRNEPARVFFGETVTKRKFPAMAMFAWVSSPESVPRATLHSQEIPTEGNNWSGQNTTGYRNPTMDLLLEKIELELDRTKRKGLWSRLQKLYAVDLPALPLYFRANAFIYPKTLTGIRPTGHQFPSTMWIEHWRPATR